jgi:hypothetical protein
MKKLIVALLIIICFSPIYTAFAETDFSMEKQHNTTNYYDGNRGKVRNPYVTGGKIVYPEGMKVKPNQDISKFKHEEPVVEPTFNIDDAYNNLIFDFIETDNSITIRLQNIYSFAVNVTVNIFYMDEDYNVIYEDKINIGKLKINGKKNAEFKAIDKDGNKIKYYDYGVDFNIEQVK